jgi:hypothetical protein
MYERMLLDRVVEPGPDAEESNSTASAADSVASKQGHGILGSAARQVHASGSAIEMQSAELESSIGMVQARDMDVVFDSVSHNSMLQEIESTGIWCRESVLSEAMKQCPNIPIIQL